MTTTHDIKEYYIDLRNEANDATNPKTLSLLERHSRTYAQKFSDSNINPALKKKAWVEHKKTLHAIERRRKQLK